MPEPATAASDPETVVRRLLHEGFSQGVIEVVEELVATGAVEHQRRPPGHPPGAEGVRAVIASLRRAFSDFRLTVQDLAVAGDMVWTRNLATGRHEGPFGPHPPSGHPICVEVFDVMRVVDGRIVEHWGLADQWTLLRQIGAIDRDAPDAPGR
jgi:predicted ester cyclase